MLTISTYFTILKPKESNVYLIYSKSAIAEYVQSNFPWQIRHAIFDIVSTVLPYI